MLLVPSSAKQWILERLEIARSNAQYFDPIGIKGVRKENRVFDCAKAWLTICIASMRSKSGGNPVPIYLGKIISEGPKFESVRDAFGAKFILFREKDAHQSMTMYPDHASKIETTFRVALKGGLHFLGSDEDEIWINRIHFDGYEHYRRNIDRSRVVGRLKSLREYCHIPNVPDLIDDNSSDHRRGNSQEYDECQLLQLTDLLLGAFRTVLIGTTSHPHSRLAYPVESLILRYQKGYARMRNSRWWSSFCMSQCHLEDGTWVFETMEYQPNYSHVQLPLSFIS
jgi:hypothetical protein